MWQKLVLLWGTGAGKHRRWLAFGAVLALSTFLNFFRLQQNGYGNLYYAAAVKSMLMSWHNCFFVAFDPGGFLSVDKPPGDLWLQTLSAKLFGFSGFSLLLPQALAGVLAVAVLFVLVQRSSGYLPALLAAVCLAITPVAVVISRDNNVDMLLVLVVLLATWAVQRATAVGSLRWLLAGAFLLGVAFTIKMFAAYLVLPALGLLYLCTAPRTWASRVAHLALALLVLLVVSFAWLVAVDLTPASQRPYVGSTRTNSELELAFNYNGLARLLRTGGAPGGGSNEPGPWRLWMQPLADQVSWLLPLALLGMGSLVRRHAPPQQWRVPLLWGGWLLTTLAVFSLAVHFLPYYTVMMAPALSALVGCGLLSLWRAYCTRLWRGWLLPCALLLTGAFQCLLLASAGWEHWLLPPLLLLLLLAGALLVMRRSDLAVRRAAVLIGIVALLLAPFAWSAVALAGPANGGNPSAGPPRSDPAALTLASFASAGTYPLTGSQQQLVRYLRAHRGQALFWLATLDTATAAPFILATGQPVMALGGFSSSDPALSPARLAQETAQGVVRFFLLPFTLSVSGHTTRLVPRGGNAASVHWIGTQCAVLSPRIWAPASPTALADRPGVLYLSADLQRIGGAVVTMLLYDCAKA
ncbi:MAG TPA: glycosyltransferase family 39 protein [Ktedonobacteraceae bacterium]|jgi:4-amino-4-deoxy-L-arabinose transferase-like glycosyltransferase